MPRKCTSSFLTCFENFGTKFLEEGVYVVPHFVKTLLLFDYIIIEGILSQMTWLNFELYVLIMLIHLGTPG